jgi:hypothetical protein
LEVLCSILRSIFVFYWFEIDGSTLNYKILLSFVPEQGNERVDLPPGISLWAFGV